MVENGDNERVEHELIFHSHRGGSIMKVLVKIKGGYQGVAQMNLVHIGGKPPSRLVRVVSLGEKQ